MNPENDGGHKRFVSSAEATALIAAVGILFYFAVLRTVVEPRLAAAFSMSLVLFYWFGWEAHHNVSHTLTLLVAVLALWLAALAYAERRTLPRAFGLGVIIGLGIMAKWGFLVVIAGFGLALAFIPAGRHVFSDPRSLAIPVGVALPLIPFALWLSGLDPNVFRFYSTHSGSIEGMFWSETELLFSVPLLLLPWILIVAALGFRYRRAVPVEETARAEIRLALSAAAVATVLMAVVVVLVSSGAVIWHAKTTFAIHYLYPLSLIAAIGIAGVIAPRIESERFAKALAMISIAAALTILLAKLGSFVIVVAGTASGNLIPYAGLADELTARGLGSAQFVTVSPRDAGNLAIYMPNARALSLSARIEPPPPDPVTGRPCVLLWSADRPTRPAPKRFLARLGMKTEANTIEDVVVDWREPLIGAQRQSVWRLLRGTPQSKRAGGWRRKAPLTARENLERVEGIEPSEFRLVCRTHRRPCIGIHVLG